MLYHMYEYVAHLCSPLNRINSVNKVATYFCCTHSALRENTAYYAVSPRIPEELTGISMQDLELALQRRVDRDDVGVVNDSSPAAAEVPQERYQKPSSNSSQGLSQHYCSEGLMLVGM